MAKDSYRRFCDRVPTGCCPACGQRVPDAGLRVDLQTNALSANGMIVIVPPRTAELVEVLLQRFPSYVTREVIASKVWADNVLRGTIDAQASRSRIALRKIGYGIESALLAGYRITRLPSAPDLAPMVPVIPATTTPLPVP